MREIKYLEKEKLLLVLDVIKNPRDRLMFKLFFATFCRSNELRNIRVCDIKFNRNLIHLRAETTKTKDERLVVIPEVLKKEIADYLALKWRYDPLSLKYLFSGRQSEQISNRRIRQVFAKYSEQAQIQEVYATGADGRRLFSVTPHALRHSGIIEALNKGIPHTVVMEQSGHKSLTAFQIYSKFSVKDRQKMFIEKQVYDL